MAIDKKLIYIKTESRFNTLLNNNEIDEKSIVFIEDSKRIWTHGNFFDGDWGGLNNKPSNLVTTARTITAGKGLTGGGNLSANRTITLGTPSNITLSTTNEVTDSSHTHAFVPGGTTAQYIRGDGSLATYTTYSTMSLAELNTGTATTSRVVNSKNLNDWLSGKNYATVGYVDGLEIGGRNYFSQSNYSHHSNGGYNARSWTSAVVKVEPNTEYIISYTVTESNRLGVFHDPLGNGIYANYTDPITLVGYRNTSQGDEVSVTVKTPNREGYLVLYLSNQGNDIKEPYLMVEKGNKPTDWTPAPEDQVSDWSTTDVNSFSFIKNKPSTFTPSAHTHNASDINAGVLGIARIPTGTTSTTVALGNHTHTDYVAKSGDTMSGILTNTGAATAPALYKTSTSGNAMIRVGAASYDKGLGVSLSGDLVFGNWNTVSNLSTSWDKVYHSGNFANGTTSQYIRGDGSLATYTDTTYSLMSLAELNTGTATTSRVVNSKNLNDWLTQKRLYDDRNLAGSAISAPFVSENNEAIKLGGHVSSYSTADWLQNRPFLGYGGLIAFRMAPSYGFSGLELVYDIGRNTADGGRLAFRTVAGTGDRVDGAQGGYKPWKELSVEGHTHTFASLTSKPTTLSGYGIIDATSSSIFNTHNNDNVRHITGAERTNWNDKYTQAQSNARYLEQNRGGIADLNANAKTGVLYWGAEALNAPFAYGTLLQISNNLQELGQGRWQNQLAFGTDGGLYFRNNINSATNWNAWKTIYHTGNLNMGNYVLKSGDTMTGQLTVSNSAYETFIVRRTNVNTPSIRYENTNGWLGSLYFRGDDKAFNVITEVGNKSILEILSDGKAKFINSVTAPTFIGALSGNATSATNLSRSIIAGNGLTGGGVLNANRTITLGTPSNITLSSTNSVTASSHTHAFVPGGTTSQYIRGDGSLATYANTTYSAMSVAEGKAGSATSSRTVRADYLKQIIQHYAGGSTGIRAGASGTTTNATATNPYIKVLNNGTYGEQIRLMGGGATTVKSDASGNITISSTDNNTVYSHPTGDGNLHVPSTGTSSLGKVLRAGSTAGSISWGTLADIGAVTIDTTQTITGAKSFSSAITVSSTITASGFYQSSDIRLKNVIEPLKIDIKDILNIPSFYFTYKDKERINIGTSAQEVQKVFPEIVSTNSKGMLSVEYDKLGLIALEFIKTQQKEINDLKNELNDLKLKIDGYRN